MISMVRSSLITCIGTRNEVGWMSDKYCGAPKIPLGMPALIDKVDLAGNVTLCQELGLDFIELNMNMPYCFPDGLEPGTLRDVTRDTGIRFTMHLPDDLDLGSLHGPLRQASLSLALKTVDWAAEAGIALVNTHLQNGVCFTLPDQRVRIYERYFDRHLAGLVESFEPLVKRASLQGVTVCVENVSNFHLPFMIEIVNQLMTLKGIGLTWDVGHDALTGYKERGLILCHREHLAHMHLHDYDGIDHKELFTGEMDIMALFRFARYHQMSVVVEVKTEEALRRSIGSLRRRL